MSNHRMFSNTIIDSDDFNNLPMASQALYFRLVMKTDDEGFVGNPKMTIRAASCSEDDFQPLVTKGYVICFESGVVVITHFHIHNKIRKDRLKPSLYQSEKQQLTLSDNGMYMLKSGYDNQVSTKCQPSVNQVSTQDKKEKKEKKDKKEKNSEANFSELIPFGKHQNVLLTQADVDNLKERFPDNFQPTLDIVSEYVCNNPNTSPEQQHDLLIQQLHLSKVRGEKR